MTKKMTQNIILMVLVCGGLFYASLTFLVNPLNIKYAAAKDSLMQTEAKVAEMKQRALELPRLEADMKLLQLQVSELEKLLPREKEIPQLLRDVTKTAQKYQLKISQISPLTVVSLANYSELPFQMSVQGNYHALAFFLADLGQGARLMSARNVILTQAPPVKGSPSLINATFVLVAYTFKG